MSKAQLQRAIDAVNSRYERGLNDDDQIARMVEIDRRTKGYSYLPGWDTFELVTDEHKFKYAVEKYGYEKAAKELNPALEQKGGKEYVEQINAPYLVKENN